MSDVSAQDSRQAGQPVTLQGEFSKKLVSNTFFNLLGRSWSFVVALLLTPYILHRLDVREFGTWVVLSIFISSFNLLDMGLGSSFIKFIAEYYTYEDFDRINAVLFSGQEAMNSVLKQASTLSLGTLALLLVFKSVAWGL